ncbi:phospholipase D family protein [Dasania marina]|uniref:phospholipase D family protein n=1 Tax=Dasania marina TaxID=471499 RepID=UPI00036C754B|nr:phospholipase D family protein [Dasania marina]
MESAVVSDRLKELIDGSEVRAGVFTTYTFEPDFFELEVIPLLLPGDTPFSSDSRVKEFQVRDALRQASLPLDVFYDLQMFRKEGQVSPSMEYLCHGVHAGNAAFHPKLNFILAYSEDYESEYLLVGAGSNNLSQAGWWDNIECQHWEVVWPDEVERTFLKQLRVDVALLASWQQLSGAGGATALGKVTQFLATCTGSTNDKAAAYFGLSESPRFKPFLRSITNKRWAYTNWTLEIISPFFADDAHNKEHEFFHKLGVERIHLLLPKDQDGRALCQQKYFNHIEDQEGIEWAEWAPEALKNLSLASNNYRRLHAKVYHFYNKKQSWVFVGSVNFTHKAMHDNVEAGFFVKLGRPAPLLRVLKQTELSGFNPPSEAVPGTEAATDEALPAIHLQYDWLSRSLAANTEASESYQVDILTPEGKPAIADWLISGSANIYEGKLEQLEHLLKNGSLVTLVGVNTRTGVAFTPHTVMLQQTSWSHKPIEMPDLSAEQILAIYADMSPDRRQMLMMNAMFKKLVLAQEAGEITLLDDELASEEFFSEYAEIFHAFRRLKQRLQEALDAENMALLDYYLTGQGMDSLPTLVARASDEEAASVKPVTAYLLLLSAREIYQYKPLSKRPLIKQKLTALDNSIRAIKASSRIQLEDNSSARRKTFFVWFEQQFFKQYRAASEASL